MESLVVQDGKAYARIEAGALSLEVSASEGFLAEHIERFVELARSFGDGETPSPTVGPAPLPQIETASPRVAELGLKERALEAGLYHEDPDNGMPVLHTQVPGKTKREQMRNVALFLLYVHEGAVDSAYIKEQCRRQSCLDSANFSKAYESDPTHFIKRGRAGSKSWDLSLTIPGQKSAEALIEQMLSPEE